MNDRPWKRRVKRRKGGPIPDALNPLRQVRVMGRFVRRRVKKAGAPPGTLVHTGVQKVERVRVRVIDYDATRLEERELEGVEEAFPLRDTPSVTWLNVDGLHSVELVQRIGDHFDIHPLVLEDILSVGQRPKLDEYDHQVFLVVHMLSMEEPGPHVLDEQVSLVVGRNYVLSFQERVGDVFEPVRERLRSGRGRIRGGGPDYLAYALVDAVVDGYFGVLERLGDRTEELEARVMGDDLSDRTVRDIHEVKRELLVVRKSVWPLREIVASLLRSEGTLVSDATRVFLRDVYDHVVQVIDTVEALRDVTSGMIDLYISNVSNRTNEVMKVLTIMASIFIPLTFLAGIYGMNFTFMPELDEPWAYPALLGVMALVAGGMLAYFRRKGWL